MQSVLGSDTGITLSIFLPKYFAFIIAASKKLH